MTSSIHSIHNIGRTTSRVLLILCGALLMATNINTFVHSAGLFPGGFTGLSLLLQEALSKYLGLELPYSLFYWGLNLGPAIISFFYIGKRFTIFSCMMIWLTGLLADLMPQLNLTQDTLLCTVFGGVINGCAICCCLLADATSGGTDFIAIFISERTGRNAWNAIFLGNVAMLFAAGLLFVHQIGRKFQPEVFVFLFFDLKIEDLRASVHTHGQRGLGLVETVVEHVLYRMTVDLQQPVALKDARFFRRGTRRHSEDLRHVGPSPFPRCQRRLQNPAQNAHIRHWGAV